ncbi:MFS family transporter [Bordetella ansorpii]|uniref:MFS family transporter n=1 Tax=Bordetella ansorpii TaxID=288768 RepID=A0A157KIS4_9BORD|nr:MFS transporter [Bordetella ansorpii]SAH84481.1 MFS family transporter [Bordetella ansorpii]
MTVNAATPAGASLAPQPSAAAFGPRLAIGLLGIFIAAVMSGINSRVGSLALADLRGNLGLGIDEASWLSTAYSAGELIAMPFAAWFAVTLSLRRFHLMMLAVIVAIAIVLPWARSLELLMALRAVQGLASGALIPLLMMAALRFLPPSLRLYALAIYSMTATFSPNVAIWLTGLWTDRLSDLRLVYWQVVPAALLAAPLVAWGIPQDPPRTERFKEANGFGMAFGALGLALVAVTLDQGGRLDWFQSPLIVCAAVCGAACLGMYLLTEWHHPAPFIKLQLLERRNLGLGFTIFFFLVAILLSGSLLPVSHLTRQWEYRALQSAPIGLLIGLPQLVLAPAVSLLLYRRWVDARFTLALGLLLIAGACLLGSHLTPEWMWREFLVPQMLQAVGQPLAVVSMLFLATSVVQPTEGAYVSGIVNLLRALASLAGSAAVSRLMELRERFHAEMLLDQLGGASARGLHEPPALGAVIHQQAAVLSLADAYRVLGVAALLLIPCALVMRYVPAPQPRPRSS